MRLLTYFVASRNVSEKIYKPEKHDCVNYFMNVDKARHNLGYSPSFADAHQLFEDYKKEMETNRFGDFFQERYGSSAAYC